MMKDRFPRIILLVGPSASGKSLFSEHFRKVFPRYEATDDRYLVEEYLARNNILAINDPHVWDDIIVQLAGNLDPKKSYLVEFARGHDPNYLRAFGIETKDIYPRTIGLACEAMHPGIKGSIGIVHIFCDYRSRYKRNANRRHVTGQNLPDSVLERVFKKDVFAPKYIETAHNNLRTGFFNGSIPVVTIDNSKEIAEQDIQGHFSSLSKKAMEILTKGANNAINNKNHKTD